MTTSKHEKKKILLVIKIYKYADIIVMVFNIVKELITPIG